MDFLTTARAIIKMKKDQFNTITNSQELKSDLPKNLSKRQNVEPSYKINIKSSPNPASNVTPGPQPPNRSNDSPIIASKTIEYPTESCMNVQHTPHPTESSYNVQTSSKSEVEGTKMDTPICMVTPHIKKRSMRFEKTDPPSYEAAKSTASYISTKRPPIIILDDD